MSMFSMPGTAHPIGAAVGVAPSNVAITTVSTQVLPANGNRRYVHLSNIGNKDIYLALDQPAVADTGTVLKKGSPPLELGEDNEPPKGVINAITGGGSSTLAILEAE